MSERDTTLITEWAEGDSIVLDNVPLVIQRGIGYDLTNIYGRPERQGAPGPADHPYNTSYTQDAWTGGQLVRKLKANTVGKYWDGDAYTEATGALGHGLKVEELTMPTDSPGGQVMPLGMIGGQMFFGVGNVNGRIYCYDPATLSLAEPEIGSLSFIGTITNIGQVYRTFGELIDQPGVSLYVPTTAGYFRLDEDPQEVKQSPEAVSWASVGFAVHQNKLVRLTNAAQLFWITDHDDDWDYRGTVPDGSEMRNIARTYDDGGKRTVGVTTSGGLWLADLDNRVLMETDLDYPDHAYQGFGYASWRVSDWISVGVGIHRRDGGLISPEGLDGGDGLPDPFAGGFITDLRPSYNWLIAGIAGELQGEPANPLPDTEAFNVSQGLPYPLLSRSTQANFLGINRMGALFAWNGLGWRNLHRWNRPPTRSYVTMIPSQNLEERWQSLFWGDMDGKAYMMRIPSSYYNPLASPNLPLKRRSFFTAAELNWGMPDTPKIAKQINLKAERLYEVLEQTAYFNRIQVILHWRDLDGVVWSSDDPAVLSGPGPYPFSDGTIPVPYLELRADDALGNSRRAASIGWERYKDTGALLATGLPHEAIWFSLRFVGDDGSDYTGGVIEWYTLIARPWMRPNRVYTFQINASTANKDLSEEDILRHLDNCCLKKGGVPLVSGDRMWIVDVTRLDGSDEAGMSGRGGRTITCVEFTDFTYEAPIAIGDGSP